MNSILGMVTSPSTCGIWVPTRTFFPPYLSHSVSLALIPSLQLSRPSSLNHNFPQLSHPLTQHSPLQHSFTSNVLYLYIYIYIFVLQLCYISIVLCFYNIGNIFCQLILWLFARFFFKEKIRTYQGIFFCQCKYCD